MCKQHHGCSEHNTTICKSQYSCSDCGLIHCKADTTQELPQGIARCMNYAFFFNIYMQWCTQLHSQMCITKRRHLHKEIQHRYYTKRFTWSQVTCTRCRDDSGMLNLLSFGSIESEDALLNCFSLDWGVNLPYGGNTATMVITEGEGFTWYLKAIHQELLVIVDSIHIEAVVITGTLHFKPVLAIFGWIGIQVCQSLLDLTGQVIRILSEYLSSPFAIEHIQKCAESVVIQPIPPFAWTAQPEEIINWSGFTCFRKQLILRIMAW